MKNKKIQLKTKRLCMEPKTLEELRNAKMRENDPEMKKAYQDMIDGMEAHPEEWIWYTDWTISLRKEKVAIGGVGFKGAPDEKAEVEIGYGIDEPYRRQGYGLEAVNAMLEWAYSNEKVYFVMAETAPDNIASQELLKKAGFVENGTFGEEGPRFEKERPASGYMATYMCLGLSVGMCFGLSLFDNLAMGMCLGMALGICIGAGLDSQEKKKREEIREQRSGKTEE